MSFLDWEYDEFTPKHTPLRANLEIGCWRVELWHEYKLYGELPTEVYLIEEQFGKLRLICIDPAINTNYENMEELNSRASYIFLSEIRRSENLREGIERANSILYDSSLPYLAGANLCFTAVELDLFENTLISGFRGGDTELHINGEPVLSGSCFKDEFNQRYKDAVIDKDNNHESISNWGLQEQFLTIDSYISTPIGVGRELILEEIPASFINSEINSLTIATDGAIGRDGRLIIEHSELEKVCHFDSNGLASPHGDRVVISVCKNK